MKLLDEIFGTIVTLSEAEPVAIPMTIKETPEVIRVDPQELENAYIFDPVAFNSVNRAVQLIMSAGYEVKAESDEVRTHFTEFLDQIGRVGEDITFHEILQTVFQHQMIYGNAYIETVLNKQKNLVTDLAIIDPKRMDFAKDSSGKIVLNEFGKPIGYVQKFPWDVSTTGKGDPKPEKVSLMQNQIFLIPQRIAHFKLFTFGDRFYGLGLIEPAYKTIIRKQNIEEGQANSIYARGLYPIIDKVGDENHHPTPQQIQDAAKNLAKLKHSRYLAIPFWHDIKPLEIKQSDIVEKTAEYLTQAQCTAAGMAVALATGAGEKTNRATLDTQLRFLLFSLNDIATQTASTFKKYIFRRISELKGLKEVPSLVWKDIGSEFFARSQK